MTEDSDEPIGDEKRVARGETFSRAQPGSAQLSNRKALTVTQRLVRPPGERNRTLLVRIDSADAGQVVSLDGEEFTVGRHPDNHACIDDPGLSRHHARLVKQGDQWTIEDLQSSNGTFVNGEPTSGSPLTNGDTLQFGPRVCFRLSVASADEERVLKQLYESSVRDPLTQCFNRHYLSGQLLSEVSFAQRHQADLSVLMFDIDFFKRVNDTYGHQAGDLVLVAVAKRVQQQLRTEDLLARYGGEEFVVVLRGVTVAGTARAAERLREAIEREPVQLEADSIAVTVSVGCGSLGECDETTPDGLIQLADRRLYAAKRAGRNCVISQ